MKLGVSHTNKNGKNTTTVHYEGIISTEMKDLKLDTSVKSFNYGSIEYKNDLQERVVTIVFTNRIDGNPPREVNLQYAEVCDLLELLYEIRQK